MIVRVCVSPRLYGFTKLVSHTKVRCIHKVNISQSALYRMRHRVGLPLILFVAQCPFCPPRHGCTVLDGWARPKTPARPNRSEKSTGQTGGVGSEEMATVGSERVRKIIVEVKKRASKRAIAAKKIPRSVSDPGKSEGVTQSESEKSTNGSGCVGSSQRGDESGRI